MYGIRTTRVILLWLPDQGTAMNQSTKKKWTPEEYFEFELTSETRHEYFQGEIYAMTGGSPKHSLIAGNAYASLHGQLRKQPCRVYTSDLRLSISAVSLYTYPDIMVICGELEYAFTRRDTVTNPVLILEVLSPSTESYDRGKKFQHYRTLDSSQEYIVISQDAAHIERFTRQPDGD